MKKVLFISNMKGMWPYSYMIRDYIKNQKNIVYTLDIGKHLIQKDDSINFIKRFSIPPPFKNKYTRFLQNTIDKHTYRRVIRDLNEDFDVVILFYLIPLYNDLADLLHQVSKKLILIYAGSDFYRAAVSKLRKDKRILDNVDKIIFGNSGMLKDFDSFYNNYGEKCYVQYLGSMILDEIAMLQKNKAELKRKYGVSSSICITIGYSGAKTQQHDKILNAIINVIKGKDVVLIFPATYGASDPSYICGLKNLVTTQEIKQLWFEEKLTDKEIAEIRGISDITINMQITDAASASLVEYIATGNIMLIADWLPYHFWDELSLKYRKVNFDNLGIELKRVLKNLDEKLTEVESNKNKVIENFAWSVVAKQLYDQIMSQ